MANLRRLGVLGLGFGVLAFFVLGAILFDYAHSLARFFSLAAYAFSFSLFLILFQQLRIRVGLLEEIGKRSFSMYILHFFILNMIEYLFNIRFEVFDGYLATKAVMHLLVAVFITYILADFTKRFIEDYFIRYGRVVADRYLSGRWS